MFDNGTTKTARRENSIRIQLQAASDGEMKYSQGGKPYASLRGFYSQGKDKTTGEFLPSIWFTVKAFSPDSKPSAEVSALDALKKGDKFVAYGHIGLEEWKGDDGNVRSTMTLYAYKVESAVEPALEGEP